MAQIWIIICLINSKDMILRMITTRRATPHKNHVKKHVRRKLSYKNTCRKTKWQPIIDTLRTDYYQDIIVLFNSIPYKMSYKVHHDRAA